MSRDDFFVIAVADHIVEKPLIFIARLPPEQRRHLGAGTDQDLEEFYVTVDVEKAEKFEVEALAQNTCEGLNIYIDLGRGSWRRDDTGHLIESPEKLEVYFVETTRTFTKKPA